MIPLMTSPEDRPERRTKTIPIAGHQFLVKELTDTQIMHLNRYARILSGENVATDMKSEAMDRMFTIVHSCFADPEQLQFLIGLEEAGDVRLRDLTVLATANFSEEEASAPVVVRRRGRPRKSS
jgi:hypothetical protein